MISSGVLQLIPGFRPSKPCRCGPRSGVSDHSLYVLLPEFHALREFLHLTTGGIDLVIIITEPLIARPEKIKP